jgi:aconitate hydratase 2/2-methylisocitrate dehydratase
VHLNKEPIIEYINSNITMLKWMIATGYSDVRTIKRRIAAMQAWLADPQLLKADADAEYAAVIEIDLADIVEPIVACPNDPDDVKTLADVAGAKIDEVFIGSCMTNIGHFRAASKLLENKRDIPVKLWMAPPTKMDAKQLSEEGHYGVLGSAGARMEMPGCVCAWAIRRRSRRAQPCFPPAHVISPTGWGKTAMCIWVVQSWPRFAQSWDVFRPKPNTWPTWWC